REALVFTGVRLSYAAFGAHVGRVARALAALGVERGTAVAIMLPNLPQTEIAFYAALALGARVVLTNPLYTSTEVVHQWNDAGCEVAVVADFVHGPVVEPVRRELPVREYVVSSIPDHMPWLLRRIAPLKLRRMDPPRWAAVAYGEHVRPWRALLRGPAAPVPRGNAGLDDVALLQYTGGTTGASKGAVLTHRNLSWNVQQVRAWFTDCREGGEVMLTALPLFHVFGMTVCMNFSIAVGATQVVVANPRDIPALIAAIAKERVTLFPGVPALFDKIVQHPASQGADLTSVKSCFSGSAPLASDVRRRFEERTQSVIVEGFGLTETSPVTHVNPLQGVRKDASIGVPVPDTDAVVVDPETGKRLGLGEPGELLLRGPQVFQGYWNRPQESAHALRDGWFHTGDLATVDADGYFRIVGRLKEMINVKGLKVFPDEVDDVLGRHPAVLESATIGVPAEHGNELVKAFVVLAPGQRATAAELEAHCRGALAAYKVPREFEFLDALPRSSVMKVLRKDLLARELARKQAAPR
ncbi:MAG TPA: long-chain fatty acid--CoA ligase, partial [Planctomycetota bacterium]|nr:long-chain fatty acid--CoA ligase [Planctomycetota bacterium]